MASGAKCFIFNRESDWKEGGISRNLEIKEDKLVFENKTGDSAIYISKPFDSLQSSTIWHRLRLKIDLPSSASYTLKIYANDSPEIKLPRNEKAKDNVLDLNDYLSDSTIDIGRKLDIFDAIGAKSYESPTDILLYGFKGRYLWICLEIVSYERVPVVIDSVKIEFPKVTFMDYLPEIYRKNETENSFLTRFLGIFQSIYVDLEDEIDFVALNFDPDRTTKDFLSWIASWLSVKDAAIWGEKRLRKLIKESVKIYKMKGTKRAISRIVEEYTGIEPIIVEQFDVKENMVYKKQKDVIENLFGDNGYVFTVMVPGVHVKDNESYVELLKVINSVKPVDSICNLVVLNDQIYLDNHSYIGINSFITKNEDLTLDRKQRDTNNLAVAANSAACDF